MSQGDEGQGGAEATTEGECCSKGQVGGWALQGWNKPDVSGMLVLLLDELDPFGTVTCISCKAS